MSLYGALTDVF